LRGRSRYRDGAMVLCPRGRAFQEEREAGSRPDEEMFSHTDCGCAEMNFELGQRRRASLKACRAKQTRGEILPKARAGRGVLLSAGEKIPAEHPLNPRTCFVSQVGDCVEEGQAGWRVKSTLGPPKHRVWSSKNAFKGSERGGSAPGGGVTIEPQADGGHAEKKKAGSPNTNAFQNRLERGGKSGC